MSPRGQVACRLSQSMVNAVRSNPAPARAWGELFIRTGVTRVTADADSVRPERGPCRPGLRAAGITWQATASSATSSATVSTFSATVTGELLVFQPTARLAASPSQPRRPVRSLTGGSAISPYGSGALKRILWTSQAAPATRCPAGHFEATHR